MLHYFSSLRLLAALLIISSVAMGQSPRKVLVEEFTNASSIEAAQQDNIFMRYIQQSSLAHHVIPIIYHTNFPGRDSINRLDSTIHNARTAFYSIDRVPQVRVNGTLPSSSGALPPGSAADTAALSATIGSMRGMTSPITITIESTHRSDEIEGVVKVKSSEALSGARLHIVVMQPALYILNAGDLSIPMFSFVPRSMIHGVEGSPLTLAAGETKEFPIEIPMEADWESNDMYLVAFVQDPSTREVLQAEHTMMQPIITTSQQQLQIQQEVQPIEWKCELSATVTGRYHYGVYGSLPIGWDATVKVDGEQVISGDSIALEGGVPRELTVTIVPNEISKLRKGALMIEIKGSRGSNTLTPFVLYSGKIETILLLRDYSPGMIELYSATLERVGRPYITLSEFEVSRFDLSKYITLFAFGQTGLTYDEIEMIRTTIDNGGRVFITGPEIAYSLADPSATNREIFPRDTAFLRNYLHADYVRDDAGRGSVEGVEGDPVGIGLRTSITDGYPNQDFPDEITPANGAIPVFHYGTTKEQVAGIRYADARGRLIYLAFGVEGIGDPQKRQTLVDEGIKWLLGLSSVEAPTHADGALGDPFPNPVSNICMLPVELDRASHCRVTLHDIRGAEIARLADEPREAGTNIFRFDASQIPSGVYSVRIEIAGKCSARLITVMH